MFKNKFGHCNVPPICAENVPGGCCNTLRSSYKQRLKRGQKQVGDLSEDRIERLEKTGSNGIST